MNEAELKKHLLLALENICFLDMPFSKLLFVEALLQPGKLSDNLVLSPTKTTSLVKKLFPDRRDRQNFISYLLRSINKKYCKKCDCVKDISDFGVNNTNLDGLMGSCRVCHNKEQKNYYDRTPEAQNSRVRKRDRKLDRSLSQSEIEFIFNKFGNKCVYCGYDNLDHNIDYGQNLHLDHIIPFSKGGTTTVDNIQLLCRSCNVSKGSRV